MLSKLIESKDSETLSNSIKLLTLFNKHLLHDDSYIYLSAINGLVSLGSITEATSSVISSLCQNYAQLDKTLQKKASERGQETGQLKTQVEPSRVHGGTVVVGVEVRMKIGEALVKVARGCGELLPHYLDEISSALFYNMRDPDPLIKASSLSCLAELSAGVKFSFNKIQTEASYKILSNTICTIHVYECNIRFMCVCTYNNYYNEHLCKLA